MPHLILFYPHAQSSMQPARMTEGSIWQIAAKARQHVCPEHQHRIEIVQLATRVGRAEINGMRFAAQWDVEAGLVDDAGHPVLGLTEADPHARLVSVRLNRELIGNNEALLRSTAAHELAHLVFDAPSWLQGFGQADAAPITSTPPAPSQPRTGRVDWAEWRANEFMGAFLAPRHLLHSELVKHAQARGLPLVERVPAGALPLIGLEGYSPWLDILSNELAALFGLSASFIAVRLEKYRLVAGLQAELA